MLQSSAHVRHDSAAHHTTGLNRCNAAWEHTPPLNTGPALCPYVPGSHLQCQQSTKSTSQRQPAHHTPLDMPGTGTRQEGTACSAPTASLQWVQRVGPPAAPCGVAPARLQARPDPRRLRQRHLPSCAAAAASLQGFKLGRGAYCSFTFPVILRLRSSTSAISSWRLDLKSR